jgi:hypothetical protein
MDLSVTDFGKPFRAVDIKIRRARQHLAELEATVEAYIATEPAKFETTVSKPKVQYVFSVTGVPDVVSAIIGDIVHNLRTSLDLLACELCHDEEAAFPFAKREETLEETIRATRFYKAGDEAVRLVREIKPYVGGDIALRAIHDYDIQDKHRAIILSPISAATPVLDTWTWQIVGDPNKASDLKLVFAVDSPFGQAELIKTMHELVELTARIVESFKRLSVPAGTPPIVGKDQIVRNMGA